MKKAFLLIVACSFSLVGCVSIDDYQQVEAELDVAFDVIEEQNEIIAAQEAAYIELESQATELAEFTLKAIDYIKYLEEMLDSMFYEG